MRQISLAAMQIELTRADNTDQICSEILLTKRVFPFVDMVVLAELCWFGPLVETAQKYDKVEAALQRIGREAGIWLVGGSAYRREGDKVYNTCPVVNPAGDVVCRYNKIYPFLPYEAGVACGDRCEVFDVPGIGKFGISICYDMWFPETIRQMTWMGAEVILHPSMTYTIDRDCETAISRANAAMHQCYFVDLNIVGMGGGLSGVYGPGGEIVHKALTGREVIVVDLDLDHVKRVRERGWHGLGQVIKSYRDGDVRYPAYEKDAPASPAFEALGPMHFHKARDWSK